MHRAPPDARVVSRHPREARRRRDEHVRARVGHVRLVELPVGADALRGEVAADCAVVELLPGGQAALDGRLQGRESSQ